MIDLVWPCIALLLLAEGLFPALGRRAGRRPFPVLLPIARTYPLVTTLTVSGVGRSGNDITATQRVPIGQRVTASTPVLAATYSRAMAPAAALLAMPRLVLGTGVGASAPAVSSPSSPIGT